MVSFLGKGGVGKLEGVRSVGWGGRSTLSVLSIDGCQEYLREVQVDGVDKKAAKDVDVDDQAVFVVVM